MNETRLAPGARPGDVIREALWAHPLNQRPTWAQISVPAAKARRAGLDVNRVVRPGESVTTETGCPTIFVGRAPSGTLWVVYNPKHIWGAASRLALLWARALAAQTVGAVR
jgi:hypothetical protein